MLVKYSRVSIWRTGCVVNSWSLKAGKEVFHNDASVIPNSAGSGPDYLFTKRLRLNSVWTGCASAFSNAHAPNEFEVVDDFFKGIAYAGTIMEKFAES